MNSVFFQDRWLRLRGTSWLWHGPRNCVGMVQTGRGAYSLSPIKLTFYIFFDGFLGNATTQPLRLRLCGDEVPHPVQSWTTWLVEQARFLFSFIQLELLYSFLYSNSSCLWGPVFFCWGKNVRKAGVFFEHSIPNIPHRNRTCELGKGWDLICTSQWYQWTRDLENMR